MTHRTRLAIVALLVADLAFAPAVYAQHRVQQHHYAHRGGGNAGAAVAFGILSLGMAAIAAANQPPAYYAPPPVYSPSPYAPYPGYYPPPPAVYYGSPY